MANNEKVKQLSGKFIILHFANGKKKMATKLSSLQ